MHAMQSYRVVILLMIQVVNKYNSSP